MGFQEKMQEQLLNSVGDFTWNFGNHFFIETNMGNYVWSEGDNSITRFDGGYDKWCKSEGIPYGRCKGKHIVKNYVGEDVMFNGNI